MSGFNQHIHAAGLDGDTGNTFANWLIKQRLTLYRLSKLTGISKGQLSDYKNAVHRPTVRSAKRISSALGLPYGNFVKEIGGVAVRKAPPDRRQYCVTCRRALPKAA